MFLRVLRFPLPIISPTASHSSSSIIRGRYIRPISGRRTNWTQSHSTARSKKKYIYIYSFNCCTSNNSAYHRRCIASMVIAPASNQLKRKEYQCNLVIYVRFPYDTQGSGLRSLSESVTGLFLSISRFVRQISFTISFCQAVVEDSFCN
jgi:hypothetical protein